MTTVSWTIGLMRHRSPKRRVALQGWLRLLSEDGVTYLSSGDFSRHWVAAVDMAGGAEQHWRVDGVSAFPSYHLQLCADPSGALRRAAPPRSLRRRLSR